MFILCHCIYKCYCEHDNMKVHRWILCMVFFFYSILVENSFSKGVKIFADLIDMYSIIIKAIIEYFVLPKSKNICRSN